jgi:hypothetical protein
VLVFVRNGGGHVSLYGGEDGSAFHVLGGNRSDRVCVVRVAKGRIYAARRPLYRVQPANSRPIHLKATGAPVAERSLILSARFRPFPPAVGSAPGAVIRGANT